MTLDRILFYFLAGLAVASGALMVTRKNVVHSAVFLITALLATAGIFLQLQAEFLFAVQIILYVGGIMVLFVFVIMLVNLDVSMRQLPFNKQGWVAMLLGVALGAELLVALWGGTGTLGLPPAAGPAAAMGNTEVVSDMLFQSYMVPFEAASILLLVAMIGAVLMAKRRV